MGQERSVRILPGTLCAELYGREETIERYYCNYGLNPAYRSALETSGLRVSAEDWEGEVRIVELSGHPFFVGTLFLPQMSSRPSRPHPLLIGFAEALGATAPSARAGGTQSPDPA